MRGVGGPLLCISDLLNDVGEENSGAPHDHSPPPASADVSNLPASDLPKLFQENFNELKGALEGEDHSWTALTLKRELKLTSQKKERPKPQQALCSALETANKLVDSTNSQVTSLSGKVEELERIVNRRDSAITEAKTIQGSLNL